MNQPSLDKQQTLDIVRSQHKALLAHMSRGGEVSPEQVQLFLDTSAQAGATVNDAENRSILHELMRYWSSIVYEKTGAYPVVELQPFDQFMVHGEEREKPKPFFQRSTQPSIPVVTSPAYQSLSETQRTSETLLSSTNKQNRSSMIERVHSIWISGVLEQSLPGATCIELNLQEEPNRVDSPWRLLLTEVDPPTRSFPPGTRITQVYDAANGELLILGEPGSGKTTLLLELTRDLLERARYNEKHSIPIIFNLSSWTTRQQSIADWVVEEMTMKYEVPRTVGKLWIDTNQVLLLFDGLDEVNPANRGACIDSINDYRHQHGFVSIVVCSRSEEYLALSKRLLLRSAMVVQPPTEQQVEKYLESVGEGLHALRLALRSDPVLQEIATTPLMLSILILAYHGKKTEDLPTGISREERRRQVFASYTQRMLQRRRLSARYTTVQTMRWLGWLARQMVEHNQVEFYLEGMQPDALPSKQLRQIYQFLAVKLPAMMISGLVSLLVFGIIFSPASSLIYGVIGILLGAIASRSRTVNSPSEQAVRAQRRIWSNPITATYIKNCLIYGVVYGLIGELNGLAFGLRYGSVVGFSLTFLGIVIGCIFTRLYENITIEIRPVEILSWSWNRLWNNFISIRSVTNSVLIGLGIGLGVGFIGGSSAGLGYGLSTGLVSWLFLGLFGGLSSGTLDRHRGIQPNQGIRRSLRNGLLIGFMSAFLGLLCYWLIAGLSHEVITYVGSGTGTGQSVELSVGSNFWLSSSLISGLIVGLLGGLFNGGLAYIQHRILRLLLWQAGSIPQNYEKFLDYAVDRILLHKVGGGYRFVHRLLLKYFASLATSPTSSEQLE